MMTKCNNNKMKYHKTEYSILHSPFGSVTRLNRTKAKSNGWFAVLEKTLLVRYTVPMKSPETPRTFALDNDQGDEQQEAAPESKSAAEQFYNEHRDFFTAYAGDTSLRIQPPLPGKKGFAIDLENGTLYADPSFFAERGYEGDKITFGYLHEFEHFRELRTLLAEPRGTIVFRRLMEKAKAKPRYHILDNRFDDIKMNRAVADRAPSLRETRSTVYRENLFASADLTQKPKHLQFAYTLLREAMLPDEPVIVDPAVRSEIDALKKMTNRAGVNVLDFASDPRTSMSTRLKLQERFLEPAYERLFQEDVAEKQKAPESSSPSDETEQGEPDESGEQKGESGKPQAEPKHKGKGEKGEPAKPEDYFADEYDEFFAKQPDPISIEDIEKAVKEFAAQKKKEKSADDLALEAIARAEGVTVEDLKEYQRFWQDLESLQNPETNESVVEELREIFRQIIAERKKQTTSSRLPVREGEILARPAEAVIAIKAGEREPAVWETVEQKEKPRELFGDFDVTVVADRSGSMRGSKAIEQRRAVALVLEALKDFADDLDEWQPDLAYDLNVRTEAWSFGDEAQVNVLKPLSTQLTDRERVAVYKELATTPGNKTMDFLALEAIASALPDEDRAKLASRTLKKVIIVMSDGESDNPARVQAVARTFRELGVAVIGVGITAEGKAVVATYAPNGIVCEKAENLPTVLGALLQDQLKGLLLNKAPF